MMTRDEAEAAARKGAKIRHEGWGPHMWLTIKDGWAIWDYGGSTAPDLAERGGPDGWSIVEPAPTPPPNIGEHDSIMAMLQEREDRAAFRTSRKPDALGAMGDEEIARAGLAHSFNDADAIREAIRLTRQSVLAQLTANEERAVKKGLDASRATATIEGGIRAALAAIREGL